ncbi:MAG: hypothetical protein VCA55_04360 [Verrucomicrobiales bacterium]
MNRKEELITRWIDGALDGDTREEFDALMADDPEFCARIRAEAEETGRTLRSEISAEVEPPYPDFFNSQIQKRIREQDNAVVHGYARSSTSVLWWLRSPFTWGAAAVFMVLLLTRNDDRRDAGGSYVVSTYAPDPAVSVERAEYDDDAGATVIMLSGLARIPDDVEVRGRDITAYEPAGPRGGGRFYTGEAQLAYIMETDVNGAPDVLVRSEGS